MRSYSQFFSKKYGGKWTYQQYGQWTCDDGKRSIARVSEGIDIFGEPTGVGYYLYSEGPTIRVSFTK